MHNDHYPYLRGIIASCGFTRLIIPYTWRARKRGLSKNNLPGLIDQALNGIFWFPDEPELFCSFAAFALAERCILFALASVVGYIFLPHLAPRGTTTIIVSVFFLSGVQLIFIGMLGEYGTSIDSQFGRGPIGVERERLNIDRPVAAPTLAKTPTLAK